MGIGNIGWTEFVVILAIALIFFGPRRLPGLAQTIGKSLREFQKALNEVKSEIAQAGREADTRNAITRIPPRPAETAPGAAAEVGGSAYTTELTREAEVVVEEEHDDETEDEAEVTVTPRRPAPTATAPATEPGSPENPEPGADPEPATDEAKTRHADPGDSDRT
ncbi:MAG: twin-arginine translocase TatA/TatE family subunit [Gemmatimonadales bacterium]|jgi:Tat protein translocase TatB subunit